MSIVGVTSIVLAAFVLEFFLFVKRVEIDSEELRLFYLYRTKNIKISEIKFIAKAFFREEIKIIMKDRSPLYILERFTFAKEDIQRIINILNKRINNQSSLT